LGIACVAGRPQLTSTMSFDHQRPVSLSSRAGYGTLFAGKPQHWPVGPAHFRCPDNAA
jgi:hypothetical protein